MYEKINLNNTLSKLSEDQQKKKLEELSNKTEIEELDLGSNYLTEATADIIASILCNNPNLKRLNLSNNDFRDNGMSRIFSALMNSNKLVNLDIVDNNIEGEKTYEDLAELIKNSGIKILCIGAKRIMGSSAGRHTFFDKNYGKELKKRGERLYHNTWWPEGYYNAGFNECAWRDVDNILSALENRNEIGNPLDFCYLISSKRTTLSIQRKYDENNQPYFTYDRKKDAIFSYTLEYYKNDEDNRDISQHLAQLETVTKPCCYL
ncbi:MAG: hypothetical protein AMJ43_02310 [Coxiella sp. DG_40]|nr:MAG: hypothetical protein AMJ43_02310 [Coxiella sp. DG_40]